MTLCLKCHSKHSTKNLLLKESRDINVNSASLVTLLIFKGSITT